MGEIEEDLMEEDRGSESGWLAQKMANTESNGPL